ncbi:hypothetical protein D3C74_370600 [compost metagenome]
MISLIVFLDMAVKKETIAPKKDCITTPERIRLSIGIFPFSLASHMTIHSVAAPVKNATNGRVNTPATENCHPKKISTAAPTAEPDDTPSVNGSANGLRSTP